MKTGGRKYTKVRSFTSALALFLLAACSTISLGTSIDYRAIDFLDDDIASMVMAIDVPVVLVPVPGEIQFILNVVPIKGRPRQVAAYLERADAVDIAEKLPPPAANRGYFLFEFSDADKTAFRKLQAWMRKISSGAGEGRSLLSVEMVPRFCALNPIDTAQTTYSVLVALEGRISTQPLIASETIDTLLAKSGQEKLLSCSEVN